MMICGECGKKMNKYLFGYQCNNKDCRYGDTGLNVHIGRGRPPKVYDWNSYSVRDDVVVCGFCGNPFTEFGLRVHVPRIHKGDMK